MSTHRSSSFLTPALSVYLDVVRLLAAFAVLVGHLDQDGLYMSWLLIGQFSHEAVIVFFVLSGLVIAHTTSHSPGAHWTGYAVARAARIYSVVLPAIALSFFVKALAVWLDPSLGGKFFDKELTAPNLFGALFFLGESWGMPGDLPWNGPFWSLCYEVWYYVIFGLLVFATPRRRWSLVAAAALIAGPGILVLAPLWLLGAALSRYGHCISLKPAVAFVVWLMSIGAMLALHASGLETLIQKTLYNQVPGFWRLEASQRFVTDYAWGVLVAVNFICFRLFGDCIGAAVNRVAPMVQFGAAYTFSLYLYHRPLSEFFGHFMPNTDKLLMHSLLALMVVVALCVALGHVTEARKGSARRACRWLLRRWLPVRADSNR